MNIASWLKLGQEALAELRAIRKLLTELVAETRERG
jgi:hypothetical protein